MTADLDRLLGPSKVRREREAQDAPWERAIRERIRAERAARDRAEYERALALLGRESEGSDGVSPDGGRISDLGPRLRRERGDVEVSLEREAIDAAAPKPKTRRVKRAHRVWAPDALLRAGTIGLHHHNAAFRLEGEWQLGMEGAREAHSRLMRIAAGSTADGFNDARLASLASCRAAKITIGAALWPVVSWCVLSTGSLSGFAQVKGWVSRADGEPDHKRAGRLLVESLTRLAALYDAPIAFLWRDRLAEEDAAAELEASRPGPKRRVRIEHLF